MKRFLLLSLLLLVQPVQAGDAKPERIEPAGFAGHLLVSGAPSPSDAMIEKVIALAGGPKAHLLVVYPSKIPDITFTDRVVTLATKTKAKAEIVSPEMLTKEDAKVTAVWFAVRTPDKNTTAYCTRLLERGGVVAMGADALACAGPLLSRCELYIKDAKTPSPGSLAVAIAPKATLWIHKREVRVLGDEQVRIVLRASESLPERTVTLEGEEVGDLTALRRAAQARSDAPFPPRTPGTPEVPKGTLFIVGGGGTPAGMMTQFVDAAGGAGKAHIVILPTAIPDPIPKRDGLVDVLKKAGAKKVTILKGRTLAEVESKEYLDALREATGIWFDGGRQWRFVDAYEGTKAQDLMMDVLRRGGAIAGSSAGATIQGDYLCRGSPFGNLEIRCEGYERGFGYLPGTAIDQHFSQRKRFADMTGLMKRYPQLLGIGIDESTAIVVRGHVADVIGKGKVHFYDATRTPGANEPDYIAVSDKGRYDLKARKVIEK